jgi:hypothetical protein
MIGVSHTSRQRIGRVALMAVCLALSGGWLAPGLGKAGETPPPASAAGEGLNVEVVKKGLGKEVTIRQGAREWYLLIEVTPENTVVVRQEKNQDAYVVDESETHDRSLTPAEVDSAIDDFINSVKAQVKKRK